MDLNGILLGVFLLALAMAIVLYLPARLTRRAMHQVIRRFYEKEALDPDGARTLDELGMGSSRYELEIVEGEESASFGKHV